MSDDQLTAAELHADGEVPTGLLEAFWAYERALGTDDVAELDRLFAAGPHTLRGDAAGLLVGHEQIAAFRSSRGVRRAARSSRCTSARSRLTTHSSSR